jgi:hypothetical protein
MLTQLRHPIYRFLNLSEILKASQVNVDADQVVIISIFSRTKLCFTKLPRKTVSNWVIFSLNLSEEWWSFQRLSNFFDRIWHGIQDWDKNKRLRRNYRTVYVKLRWYQIIFTITNTNRLPNCDQIRLNIEKCFTILPI